MLRRNAVLGLYLQPETMLYEITDLAPIWIVASIYERDLAHVQKGQTARFSAPGLGGETITVRVDLVEPQVDVATRRLRDGVRSATLSGQVHAVPGLRAHAPGHGEHGGRLQERHRAAVEVT